MIERFTRVHAPRPRRLTADDRMRIRLGELAWLLTWIVMAGTFGGNGSLGPFLCGLLCCWGLFEIELWVEAGRG